MLPKKSETKIKKVTQQIKVTGDTVDKVATPGNDGSPHSGIQAGETNSSIHPVKLATIYSSWGDDDCTYDENGVCDNQKHWGANE